MNKLTFKKEPRITGLAGVGYPNPSTIIKWNKKEVGYIGAPNWLSKDNKWVIRFTIKTNNPLGWKWISLKGRFDSEEEARIHIKKNGERIFKLNLHQMEN
jgi:hypothetical protein